MRRAGVFVLGMVLRGAGVVFLMHAGRIFGTGAGMELAACIAVGLVLIHGADDVTS